MKLAADTMLSGADGMKIARDIMNPAVGGWKAGVIETYN
jgi:hypothetical protein